MEDRSTIEIGVLGVLRYFDLFKFPLRIDEVHKYLTVRCTREEVYDHLQKMVRSQEIYYINGCYLLSENEEMVKRKDRGLANAQKQLKKARRTANVIRSFPFVRMVSISGSLSKGYSDNSSDIDFFIMTTEDQLWTARTVLHMFKKLTFLVKKQDDFCMNYFIADNHLRLDEKNYFTAVELATLIPMHGKKKLREMLRENEWMMDYLPNFQPLDGDESERINEPKNVKWIMEKVFHSRRLNRFFLNMTDRRWRKKWKRRGFPMDEYSLAFKTTLHVSKNHPDNHQKKVLSRLHKHDEQ